MSHMCSCCSCLTCRHSAHVLLLLQVREATWSRELLAAQHAICLPVHVQLLRHLLP
jgi:hypothetical protein